MSCEPGGSLCLAHIIVDTLTSFFLTDPIQSAVAVVAFMNNVD
jgi:hypothetical protein